MKQSIQNLVTDSFCGAFKEDKDYTGFCARLIAQGILPEGVNRKDPAVKEIIRKCQLARKREQSKKAKHTEGSHV